MTQNFYITTPIYYVNDRPHIGHAYTSVACDVLARFHRLSGDTVKFLTGTDEHGQKVEKSAKAAGVEPQALADANAEHFRELTKIMNISNDDFIRTTEPRHKRSAQALWKAMQDNGFIYEDSYSGWYSVRDEAYYAESELVAGPKGKMAPTGAEVEWVEEPSYFFKLSEFGDKLLEHYEKNPEFIGPESRKNEVISFVKGGLKDLSISRTTFAWGIPVPGDEKHVMYVWLDALANYLSALGYPDSTPDLKAFWPANLHMVGKDILRFHAVYWPAFLMAAKLSLPKRVFAHGWWTIEGEKMSKSLGNVVAPADLISEFGLDQTRWFLMREVPFGNDGNFSRERMLQVINSELANNIGNLIQRTLTIVHKNCGGMIPPIEAMDAADKTSLASIEETVKNTYVPHVDSCRFHLAAETVITLSNFANNYIDQQAPWKLKKENPARMEAVLYVLIEHIRAIGILLQPFMPDFAGKILDLLAIPKEQRNFAHIGQKYALKPGGTIVAPSPIFPRIEPKA